MKKTIDQINEEIKNEKSVIASVDSGSESSASAPQHQVDAVTSATLANTVSLPQIPVMVPPPIKKE